MEYPHAYSKILSELNNAVKLTLINRYGIDIEPKTQTGLDMLREDLELVLQEDITTTAKHLIACVQKMLNALR